MFSTRGTPRSSATRIHRLGGGPCWIALELRKIVRTAVRWGVLQDVLGQISDINSGPKPEVVLVPDLGKWSRELFFATRHFRRSGVSALASGTDAAQIQINFQNVLRNESGLLSSAPWNGAISGPWRAATSSLQKHHRTASTSGAFDSLFRYPAWVWMLRSASWRERDLHLTDFRK